MTGSQIGRAILAKCRTHSAGGSGVAHSDERAFPDM